MLPALSSARFRANLRSLVVTVAQAGRATACDSRLPDDGRRHSFFRTRFCRSALIEVVRQRTRLPLRVRLQFGALRDIIAARVMGNVRVYAASMGMVLRGGAAVLFLCVGAISYAGEEPEGLRGRFTEHLKAEFELVPDFVCVQSL